jgi:hypothetical protein
MVRIRKTGTNQEPRGELSRAPRSGIRWADGFLIRLSGSRGRDWAGGSRHVPDWIGGEAAGDPGLDKGDEYGGVGRDGKGRR